MTLHTYIPQDRLRALSRGESLPDRTHGAALFADISGFTPLTEMLRDMLGSRRGAEELTKHLDAVYTALIAEVERYGGSVISFAGDAITCWFDNATAPATPRAIACAVAMQVAMQAFAVISLPNEATTALALKVSVATGPARRFVVGDPDIHFIDALAGATLERVAAGEHLAQSGDVIVDQATVDAIGAALTVKEWRTDEEGVRFAVVGALADAVAPFVVSPVPEIAAESLRPWVHDAIYEREMSGQGVFLTEFRPCVVLFVRFTDIDYDQDDAQTRLGAFIQQLQWISDRYDGTVLQITIGDKGSYAYLNFGALSVHENDARRAVKSALELRQKTTLPLQMGLTYGVLRVGAYGGTARRTYSALGDEVNLAARLMMTAAAGEIMVSGAVYKAVEKYFSAEPGPPLMMKGKAEPLPVFAITGERNQRAIRLQEPIYTLPMVGREQELQTITEKLALAATGKSQLLGIIAEAGMGKSRLVAEVIRAARKMGFVGYGGACQSDAINTPYQAWKSIWQAFFEVDHEHTLKKQMRNLEGEIEDRAPEHVPAMPLLNIVLELEIPDNDFIKTLDPQDRKIALRGLLVDCLRAAAEEGPLLIVIEDMHWIDALSHDLLEDLASELRDSAVCFVLAYRPPQMARLTMPPFEAMPNFTKIELRELNRAEAGQAIRAKLAQLYPARVGTLPSGLVGTLMARAQGNPFYLEELLNYVRDRGLDPADLDKIELPNSLHALILSRIDQLSESEKNTLRVASIIGRLFQAEWLMGYYPDLGNATQVQADLDKLAEMDITPQNSPEPGLAYLFKHIVTHEVTYESLPFATRAKLHEELASYLETAGAAADTIAFHYGHSDNTAKKREYYQKAADAAQAVSAFITAVEYLTRLLALTPESHQAAVLEKLADVYGLLRNVSKAIDYYQQALELWSRQSDAAQLIAARLQRKIIQLASEIKWSVTTQEQTVITEASRASRLALEAYSSVAPIHPETVNVLTTLSNYSSRNQTPPDWNAADRFALQALQVAEQLGDTLEISRALGTLARLHHINGRLHDYLAVSLRRLVVTAAPNFSDVHERVDVLREAGSAHLYVGQYTDALRLLSEAEALAASVFAIDQQNNALQIMSLAYFRLDRWDDVFKIETRWLDLLAHYPRPRVGAT